MSDYAQGGIARFQVEFLDHPQGAPIDPTSISLQVLQNSTPIAGPFVYPGTIVRDLLGFYHYDWSVPSAQALGSYIASWTAVVSGTSRTGYEAFNIVAGFDVITGNPSGWATLTDVSNLTGATVTSAQLTQANAVIELHAGRMYATAYTRTGTRDLDWMRRAVAYQAAWMPSQPDVFTRLELEAIAASGRPVPITPAALTLAPLARRALKRVSWLKSRSVHVRTPFTDGVGPLTTAIRDYDDDGGGF